jgi:ribonuclease D
MGVLSAPATYQPDPETMWERLRPRTNNRRMLGVLRAIAAWREREAQRVNIPRQRLLKDETLLEIAATAPATAEALLRARGVSKGFAEGKTGTALLAVIAEAKALPEDAMPQANRGKEGPRPSPALVALLKVLLAGRADENHVAARLIASSDDIDRLATEDAPDIPALHGWRRELFGEDALALKDGRIAVGVAGRRIKLIRLDAS